MIRRASFVLIAAGVLLLLASACTTSTPAPTVTATSSPGTAASAAANTPTVTATVVSTTATSFTDPWAYCTAVGTIDKPDARYTGDANPAKVQDALAVAEKLPQRFAQPTSRQVPIPWRCMDGQVWGCDPGANLPCGAANTSQTPTAAMSTYCARNPDGVLPAVVSGHDSIYAWSCKGGKAVIDRQPFSADKRGFVADFWYRLDRPAS